MVAFWAQQVMLDSVFSKLIVPDTTTLDLVRVDSVAPSCSEPAVDTALTGVFRPACRLEVFC